MPTCQTHEPRHEPRDYHRTSTRVCVHRSRCAAESPSLCSVHFQCRANVSSRAAREWLACRYTFSASSAKRKTRSYPTQDASTASGLTTPHDAWMAGPSVSEARHGSPRSAGNRLATVLLPTPGDGTFAHARRTTNGNHAGGPRYLATQSGKNTNGLGRYYPERPRQNAPPEIPVRCTEYSPSCAWPTPSHRIRVPERKPGPHG
jgi:hypothetical protein